MLGRHTARKLKKTHTLCLVRRFKAREEDETEVVEEKDEADFYDEDGGDGCNGGNDGPGGKDDPGGASFTQIA